MAANIHTDDQHAASHESGGQDEMSLASLAGTPAALATHAAELDAHTFDRRQIMRVGRYFEEYGAFASGDPNCPGANYLSASPLTIARDLTIDRIGCITTQAGGAGTHARLGIYKDDGNGYPGELLLDAGEVDVEVTAAKSITIDQQLPKGLYWTCFIADVDCEPRYRFWGTHWSPIGHSSSYYTMYLNWKKAQAYGALPDPFPSGASADGHAPGITVRIKSLD